VEFEWDSRKATSNVAKHGVAFEEAITAFDDPFALTAPDLAHSTSREERTWLIGKADSGNVVVVIFTIRRLGEVRRLISARHASRTERRRYEEAKGISL
jgi:uncharacterized DUF497 family protein